MNIKRVKTELLLEEMKTDGHAPLKFICDDEEIYYCKYIKSLNRQEINFLAYEVVANYLLNELEIPTPEIALVNVSPGTLNKDIIDENRWVREGNICFGSKDVKSSQELQAIQLINTKTEFNKLVNPNDIIKIALFDLWVDNMDRGKYFSDEGINYNLLISPVRSRQRIVAFDHAFIFGGVHSIGTFSPNGQASSNNKLVNSPYYKSIIKYIDRQTLLSVVNNFITLLPHNYDVTISNIIKELNQFWGLSLNLDLRINNFLSSREHINSCKNIIIQSKK